MYWRSLILLTPLVRVGCLPQPEDVAASTEARKLRARREGRKIIFNRQRDKITDNGTLVK